MTPELQAILPQLVIGIGTIIFSFIASLLGFWVSLKRLPGQVRLDESNTANNALDVANKATKRLVEQEDMIQNLLGEIEKMKEELKKGYGRYEGRFIVSIGDIQTVEDVSLVKIPPEPITADLQ